MTHKTDPDGRGVTFYHDGVPFAQVFDCAKCGMYGVVKQTDRLEDQTMRWFDNPRAVEDYLRQLQDAVIGRVA